MMKLNKRFVRNIRHSLSFYLSASLLTLISVLMVVTLYSSVLTIDKDFNDLMKKGNVENAQFTTLLEINEEDIQSIEKDYSVELEKIRSVDIKEKDYTLRVFAPTMKINKYQMVDGEDISSDDQILLNRDFARARGIVIGDSLTISGKVYTVTGFAVRPDYLYAQKETTDFYLDKAVFGQVTMSKAAFDKLENTQFHYAIVYHEDNSIPLRQYLYDNYFTLNYLSDEANNRIDMIKEIGKQARIFIYMAIPVMFGLIAVIVAVVLGRKVKKEQKQIGTLVALGYRRSEIIRHYSIYAAIPGIIGSIVGIALSIPCLRPFCSLFATDYEIINFNIKFYWTPVWITAFVPSVMYMLTSMITLLRLFRRNTVTLLSGSLEKSGKGKSHFLIKSKLSFHRKFQFRSLVKHKSRTFVVVMGIVIGGILCSFGLILIDSCDYLMKDSLDAAGSYEYQYFLNTLETTEPEEGEPMFAVRFEVGDGGSLFTMRGLVENPKYLILNTKSGKAMEYGRYYMTSNAAALYGVKAGDEFTFTNILSTKEYTVEIADIINDNTQCALYTSMSNVAALVGAPENSYNVVMSEKELPLDKDKVYFENSKDNIKIQLENSIRLFMNFVYVMLIFGAVLCIIVVYLTVNMLIEENMVNISMLKVLGYRKNEVNSLVLNTNHILLPISFILGLWISIELCQKLFEAFISAMNVYLEPKITVSSILICIAILGASYFLSLMMLKHKVYRINMVESLKDNRE